MYFVVGFILALVYVLLEVTYFKKFEYEPVWTGLIGAGYLLLWPLALPATVLFAAVCIIGWIAEQLY